MNPTFRNILNYHELDSILNQIDPSKGILENNRYYKDSLGFYNVPATLNFVQRLEDKVKLFVGNDIKFENTFTRIYKKDSTLNFHIDRKELDITVSLCIKRDVPWELRISHIQIQPGFTEDIELPYKESYSGFDLFPGTGVLAEGRKYPHWREAMVAEEGQTNIYTFYHWRRN